MTSLDRPVHTLYQKYLDGVEGNEVALQLWGYIPANMSECHTRMKEIRVRYGELSGEIEDLKRALKAQMKRLGILTQRASESIDSLELGVAETGQQPNCLAGPSLILNKIGYICSLSRLEGSFNPLYYVGDYDSVQAELVNARVPSPSSRGMVLTYPTPPEYEGAPIRMLPNPDEEWLKKSLEKMESNYRGLLKGVDMAKQERTLQNLYHIFTIIRDAYYSTSNVSDFSTKIIGNIVNIEAGLGVPILSPSDPSIRRFFQRGYELLLSEPNRNKFIEASNQAVDLIEFYGYRSQIGKRTKEYVPFFLECTTPSCHGSRIELKHQYENTNTAELSGRCPRCGQLYSYSINPSKPDLSEIIDIITPRVDSRQIIVDSAIPILAHVGGPGETSYYAEVIPGASRLDLPFPAYIRYTRVFYNTPWNESTGKLLNAKGCVTLTRPETYRTISSWVEAKKSGDPEKLKAAFLSLRNVLEETYSGLVKKSLEIQAEIGEIKQKLSSSEQRDSLIKEMRSKQSDNAEIEGYLSSAFGHFAPEKYGQEVSWLWMDVVLASGVGDIMNAYKRLYDGNTPNSATFYINF